MAPAFATYDKGNNGSHDGETGNAADDGPYDGATRGRLCGATIACVESDLCAAGNWALAGCIDDIQCAGKARFANRGAHTRGLGAGGLDRAVCRHCVNEYCVEQEVIYSTNMKDGFLISEHEESGWA